MEEHKEAVPDAVVQRAVMRLHKAMGHCSRSDLIRVMLHGGALQEALEFARKLRCSVCDERKRPEAEARTKLSRDIPDPEPPFAPREGGATTAKNGGSLCTQ